mmetsp:Transcript_366/g.974  ORF Transcript_366/g.974 Transcript_366/m.974 type:complete len:232 (-) Transcript_366:770-1465(-)
MPLSPPLAAVWSRPSHVAGRLLVVKLEDLQYLLGGEAGGRLQRNHAPQGRPAYPRVLQVEDLEALLDAAHVEPPGVRVQDAALLRECDVLTVHLKLGVAPLAALLRVLAQLPGKLIVLADEPPQPSVKVVLGLVERVGKLVKVLAAPEGGEEHAYEDEPNAVEVILCPLNLVDELLGGGVAGVARGLVPVIARALLVAHRGRAPKVDHHEPAVSEQEVVGLDVAVRDAADL